MSNNLDFYIEEIYRKVKKVPKNKKHIVAFRGEPKDYDKTALMPSIFRNENVEQESLSYDLAIDYKLNNHKDLYVDQATNLQHYAALSRMLDITFNCLVALFFACKSDESNKNEDAVVYVFDFPEYYSPHSKYIESLYEDALEDNDSIAYSKNFRVFSENFTNIRIKSQYGGFIFFPGKVFYPIDNVYYDKIMIPWHEKEKILQDLDILFSINESTLFPEMNEITGKMKKRLLSERSYSKPQKLTVENELLKRISNLDYELYKKRFNKTITTKEIFRITRKEKNDMINYLNMHENINKDEKENMEKLISEKIKIMNKVYGGE